MWSLYKGDKFLEPLRFSNGKSQENVVSEVLEEIKKGTKVIFIKGVCGTGKSAIALNIAKKIGKTSIVVPGKTLQRQYKKDYENEKYVLKDDKTKLKISVITGRKNHKCRFLMDNKNALPVFKREINSKLHDIFAGKREEIDYEIKKDESADNDSLPCKIEIKERNWNKLKSYLSQNKDVDPSSFTELKDIKRIPVASVCPYWSPVLPARLELKGKIFANAKKKKYMGLENTEFIFYQRKEGCPFYHQFNSFIDSDVIVFNSSKYKLESAMNRKPLTEVEIIDECDEFLDSFSNQKNLNIERLQNSLINYVNEKEKDQKEISELLEIIQHIKKDKRINDIIATKEIIPLKETGVYDLLKIILKSSDLFEEADDESYLFDCEEIAKTFKDFMSETYITAEKKEKNIMISLVTTNLAKKFKEMVDKNKAIVLMSGTLHSEQVLKDIFGLDSFKIIEAEIENQGSIIVKKTGLERDFKYSNLSNGKHSREEYLKALNKCVETAKRPTLIHINAFMDLPNKQEIQEYGLKNLVSRDEIKDSQSQDNEVETINKFKNKEIDVLFSTKVSRGIDFPGDECNSIVFTKYPNPNVQDPFWKILNRTRPEHYWEFYRDKAKRELWQKIYRGLRFKEDKVEVLSPDIRVLEGFEKK
ncbi:MAG: helicase C-terminal domain-containing protein [Nanoarchaeota archaeon]